MKPKLLNANLKGVIQLGPGSRIKVQGLENSKELNGLEGSLLQFDAVKCRWGVELDNGKKVALKMGNLVPMQAEVRPMAPGEVPGQVAQPPAVAPVRQALDNAPGDAVAADAAPSAEGGESAPPAAAAAALEATPGDDAPSVNSPNAGDGAAVAGDGAAAAGEAADAAEASDGVAAEAAGGDGPPTAEEEWPVLPTKPETLAKMRTGCWWDGGSAAKRFTEQLKANDPALVSVCLVPPKRFDADDAREICEALDGNTACRELLASGHSLSEETCQRLAGMMRATQTLQMLSIGDSSLGDGARVLFEALADNGSIASIDLEHKGLTEDALSSLAAALASRGERGTPPLASLRLSKNERMAAGIEKLSACPAPRALQLCECRLGPGQGAALGRWASGGVEDLDLRDNSALGGDGVESLLAALASSAPLRKLRLDGCSIGDDGLEAIAGALERGLQLEELFVERCEITLAGCEFLSQSLRGRRLHSLSVRANVIGDEGCELLGRCAERLDLSSTSLSGQVLSRLGDQPLVALELFSNPTLGPSVASWSSELRSGHWQRLEHLDLGGCALQDEGCMTLCNALMDRPTLMPNLSFLCLGANDVQKEEEMMDLSEKLGEARGGRLSIVWQNK